MNSRNYFLFLIFIIQLLPKAYGNEGEIEISIGTGVQDYEQHKYKVDGSVTSLHIGYTRLDQFELQIVAGYNETNFRVPTFLTDEPYDELHLDMTHFGLAAALHKYTDLLDGHWRWHIQYHELTGDLTDPRLGEVNLFGTGLRYENYNGSLFADINYFDSDYGTGVEVEQWDYGVGFSFMGGLSWIQLRQYQVQSNAPSDFNAFEILSQFWIPTNWVFGIDTLFASYSFGERQLFYDPDTMVLWNNSDILTTYLRGGVTWDMPWRAQMSVIIASAEYQNPYEDYKYESQTAFLEFKFRF